MKDVIILSLVNINEILVADVSSLEINVEPLFTFYFSALKACMTSLNFGQDRFVHDMKKTYAG